MPVSNIKLAESGDNAWPDLLEKKIIVYNGALNIAILEGGMASGKPSVSLRFDLEDGTVLVAETSLAMFLNVANMAHARYGDAGTGIAMRATGKDS